ncbi:uncharacterized protein LOC100835759 [Brachypodium distachyon]|uniref:DUF1677 family protein n=1 Tax=Brachypodium distachyon TaxID=15368 RepID=I1H4P4_BRADI|nr:uncharacterized protein LOC100835759 [Brachypodium distachyon]KQK21325.1 hypothetical protein BRADI_1g60200v3 [Brachypodium distachyon]|eukprot:XP_003557738.1 uncharacterized protein LOC100835759 [Brachypodium distachyon]
MEEAGEEEEEAAVVACECCGLTEECTARYIADVRARYGGRWICGLCGDAVAEELGRGVSPVEALDRHVSVCRARRASAPPSPEDNAGDLIAAVRVLLLRRLGSPLTTPPRRVRSTPSSPGRASADADADAPAAGSGIALVRTGSCFAALLE